MSESKPSHVIFVGDEKQQTHFVINPPGADPRDELIKKLVWALEELELLIEHSIADYDTLQAVIVLDRIVSDMEIKKYREAVLQKALVKSQEALAEAKQLGYGE